MRLVAWNIRAGGGRRWSGIVAQLRRWRPDVIALSEFRGTEPSQQIAAALNQAGWIHQSQTTLPEAPAVNALLLASRWPLQTLRPPSCVQAPARWLQAQVRAPQPMAVLLVHVPNRVTGTKYPFLNSMATMAGGWRGVPGLIVGDTNTGRIGMDEESSAFNRVEDDWMQAMESLGWHDGFRHLHPRRRQFTWYSPNGDNGFRLDQAFLQPALLQRMRRCVHRWGGAGSGRQTVLSDHAALILDFHRED